MLLAVLPWHTMHVARVPVLFTVCILCRLTMLAACLLHPIFVHCQFSALNCSIHVFYLSMCVTYASNYVHRYYTLLMLPTIHSYYYSHIYKAE